jgi:hypothetical protein
MIKLNSLAVNQFQNRKAYAWPQEEIVGVDVIYLSFHINIILCDTDVPEVLVYDFCVLNIIL